MRYTLYILILMLPLIGQAQSPNWEWAKSGQDIGTGWGLNLARDENGYIYVTGSFNNTLTIENISVTSVGGSDIFLGKYNSDGQLIWLKSAGSSGDDQGRSIDIDEAGNIFVEGNFSSTCSFDNITINTLGNSDIFLAKYDAQGNVNWVESWGSIYPDRAGDIAIDSLNNIYITGDFGADGGSPVVYGTISFGTTALTSHGYGDMFIVKMDTSANIFWARNGGGHFYEFGQKISIDKQQNVVVTGAASSNFCTFDNLSISNVQAFVAQYDSSGTIQWIKGIQGLGNYAINGNSCVLDVLDNIYIAGYTYESQNLKFGSFTLSDHHGYIAKYNKEGNFIWAKGIVDNTVDAIQNIACVDDHIYITGSIDDNGIVNSDTIQTNGWEDVWVAKLDTNGSYEWSITGGGMGLDGAYGIEVGGNDDILISGYIGSVNANFGGSILNGLDNYDVLIARVSEATGLKTLSKNRKFLIYPTPANDAVYVSGVQQNAAYKMTNLTGAIVKEGNLYKGINRIEITQLASGMYLLYAGNEVHKIVKE